MSVTQSNVRRLLLSCFIMTASCILQDNELQHGLPSNGRDRAARPNTVAENDVKNVFRNIVREFGIRSVETTQSAGNFQHTNGGGEGNGPREKREASASGSGIASGESVSGSSSGDILSGSSSGSGDTISSSGSGDTISSSGSGDTISSSGSGSGGIISGSGGCLGSSPNPILTPGGNKNRLPPVSTFFDFLLGDIVASGVSSECRDGWAELFDISDNTGTSNGERALDAFGKIGAGYFEGNTYAMGSYDECFSISNTQYCLTELTLETAKTDFELTYALCLPQACSKNDIIDSVNFTNLRLEERNVSFQLGLIRCEKENKPSYNAGAIVMICVWSLFAAMVLGATAFHIGHRKLELWKTHSSTTDTEKARPPQRPRKKSYAKIAVDFIFSFSLYKTVPTVIATPPQPRYVITSLNGIRVISMFWVIIAHTNLWYFFYISNDIAFLRDTVPRFSYKMVPNGVFAVDTFFLISGLLTTYLTLREMKKRKGKFNLLYYYLHRLLRITPVYAFVLFSYWFLTVHLADGPIWRQTIGYDSRFYQNCEKYWWTNLLYINNLYPRNHINICMPWTWYLANDVQFFILAPVIIATLYKLYKAGLIMIGVLLIGNIAILGGISGGYGLRANVAKFDEITEALDGRDTHNSTDDIYTKPWTRIGPYLIGILMGYIFYTGKRPNFHKPYNYIFYSTLWIVAMGSMFAVVFGIQPTEPLSKAEDISYHMFSRLTWAIGLSCIVFACHNGYGGVINDFFSMQFWLPLSRLTYTTYLVHAIVLFFLFFTRRQPVYSTDIFLSVYAISAIVISFIVAAVLSTVVEFPLSNVETIIYKIAGVGERESARRSVIFRDSDCETRRNDFFEDGNVANEFGGGEEVTGGEVRSEKQLELHVREEGCEIMQNYYFEENEMINELEQFHGSEYGGELGERVEVEVEIMVDGGREIEGVMGEGGREVIEDGVIVEGEGVTSDSDDVTVERVEGEGVTSDSDDVTMERVEGEGVTSDSDDVTMERVEGEGVTECGSGSEGTDVGSEGGGSEKTNNSE